MYCTDCGCKCLSKKKDTPRCRRCNSEFVRNNPSAASRYKGGKRLSYQGYVLVLNKNSKWNYAREHRLVMEKHLGRPLGAAEVVHHKNGIKTDNRIENLYLTDAASHRTLHKRTTICKVCGAPEKSKGLCQKHYAESMYKIPCRKCGKPAWKCKRNPNQICLSCARMGARNAAAKLTDRQVIAIRKERLEFGTSFRELALKYGVSPTLPHRICSGKCWTHI